MIKSSIFELNRIYMKAHLSCLFLLFLLTFNLATAQYTETINNNRPGASQGAFSVGTNVLQLESGVAFGKEQHRLRQTETNACTIDYAGRYGVWQEE